MHALPNGKLSSLTWFKFLCLALVSSLFAPNLLAQTPTLGGNNTFTGANIFPSIDGIIYVDGITHATLASAIAAAQANGGGKIILPPGIFHISANNVITVRGIHILGSGIGVTTLQIDSASGDVFTVQGGISSNNLDMNFELANMTILGVNRSAGAVLVVQGRMGYVHDLLLQDTYRGFVEQSGSNCTQASGSLPPPKYCAGDWTYSNIFHVTTAGSAGALFILGGGDGTSVGNITISNCKSLGQGAAYVEPQMIIDTGIDTLKIAHYEMGYTSGTPQRQQPAILIQDSKRNVGVNHPPRWIRISDSSLEATSTSIALHITAGYDIALTGDYWASSQQGVVIDGGIGVRVLSNVFANNQQEGVVIGGGSSDVLVADSDFSDNSQAANGQWYHINAFAGDFRITGNRFGNHLLNQGIKTAAAIVVNGPSLGQPTKNNFIISDNRCDSTAVTVTCFQDSSGATSKQMLGNLPPP